MLTVGKNEARESRAERILEESLKIRDPFGVPALVLKPPKDKPLRPLRDVKKAIWRDFFRALWSKHPIKNLFNRLGIWRDSLSSLRVQELDRWYINSIYLRGDYHVGATANLMTDFEPAFLHSPATYKEPKFSMIVMPPVSSAAADFISTVLPVGKDALKGLPFSDAELMSYVIWHEYAHGTGAHEPQADAMAGIVFRQLFKSSDILQLNADLRAVSSVLYAPPDDLVQHSWAMVDFMDAVIRMPQEQIESFSEDDIKRIRFQPHDNLAHEVWDLRSVLAQRTWGSFSPYNLSRLADIAESLPLRNGPRRHIARRFAQAARRLSQHIEPPPAASHHPAPW